MSKLASPPSSVVNTARNFAIVASKYNPEYVQGLVHHAAAEFRTRSPASNIVLHQVPGAFEIPIVVRELASQRSADAIVAIGVILKGHTDHAEHLARSVTDSLQRIALEHSVPVVHCVLSVEDEAQARERCLEGRINRGTEAARAAIDIADVIVGLRRGSSNG